MSRAMSKTLVLSRAEQISEAAIRASVAILHKPGTADLLLLWPHDHYMMLSGPEVKDASQISFPDDDLCPNNLPHEIELWVRRVKERVKQRPADRHVICFPEKSPAVTSRNESYIPELSDLAAVVARLLSSGDTLIRRAVSDDAALAYESNYYLRVLPILKAPGYSRKQNP